MKGRPGNVMSSGFWGEMEPVWVFDKNEFRCKRLRRQQKSL